MKRGLDPFRSVPILDLEEKIECLACSNEDLYLGTALGNVVHFDLSWTGRPAEDLANCTRRRGAVRLSAKRPVEQLRASHGLVFALVDGALSVLPSDIQTATGTVLSKDARCLCLHTGAEQSQAVGHGQPEVCVALKKKLVLYSYNGRTFEQRTEIPTADAACCLIWHQSRILAGFKREYVVYSDTAGVPHTACSLDGRITPQVALLPGGEVLMVVQESVGLFYSLATQQPSPKNTVSWVRKVVCVGAAGNYVLGSTGGGQVDVFGARDQKNCQTLTVEGTAVAICAGTGGRALVASENSVACLDPIPFERQVQKMLFQLRISDALDLLNASFDAEDPQREEQLNKLHLLAGWALFRELNFMQAFQHFTYSSEFQLPTLLAFWQKHLPPGWEPPPGGARTDDGAPEPCDIADFVRNRLQELRPSEDAETRASSTSANVEVADAALVTFLLRQREALLAQERMASERDRKAPAELLRAADAALLRLTVGRDEARLQELLKAGPRCNVEDCETFLREKHRWDVLARIWKGRGMHDVVLREWSRLLANGGASQGDSRQAPARLAPAQIAAEMADALRAASGLASGAELLRRHVPELLAVEPSLVLPIFTSAPRPGLTEARPLPVQEVLRLLDGHDSLVLGYLEHLDQSHKDALEPRQQTRLAAMYAAAVGAERRQGSPASASANSPTRQKLQRYLESAESLDVSTLLPQVEELGLHEERVVLLSREQRHREALRILVEQLNDLPRAELYCRVAMARRRNLVSVAEEATIFSDPPAWARGIVFGARKAPATPGLAELPVEDGPLEGIAAALATGSSGGGSSSSGAVADRPLALLLKVLLDATTGAEERPGSLPKVAAEYREAVLALLLGYAGHPDLPAQEVLGLLPGSWPLESLSGYLTKCARLCLHEHRASMLEENLSSMAYLKTFSAWAFERMRKVNITGDRCCPVCNRRFVDKDSVGKAFVAYPNETCVHLQCKEDLSVCPKTGRSFADNLSVYCHALSTDP